MKRNKHIYLRAFEHDDYKLLNKWRNNEEMFKLTCGNKYFISSVYDLDLKFLNVSDLLYSIVIKIERVYNYVFVYEHHHPLSLFFCLSTGILPFQKCC